jgi:hypothetical protein
MNMIKLSVLKNRLSGILSVGHPNISVVSGILSVMGIPPIPIPIPEEIQLLMFDDYLAIQSAPFSEMSYFFLDYIRTFGFWL